MCTERQGEGKSEILQAYLLKEFTWTNIHHRTHHLFLALKVVGDNNGGGFLWALLQGLAFHTIA